MVSQGDRLPEESGVQLLPPVPGERPEGEEEEQDECREEGFGHFGGSKV